MNDNLSKRGTMKRVRRSRAGRSLLGPIWLIAIGVLLLLNNTGQLPELNWVVALRLWPLVLVTIGVNVLVRAVPRPFGTMLSAAVALGSVALFGMILFYAESLPLVNRISEESAVGLNRETFSYPGDGIERANVSLNLSSPSTRVFPLEDDPDLIDGEISYRGQLVFSVREQDDLANIVLEVNDGGSPGFWWDPVRWFELEDEAAWQIGLARGPELDLRLSLASGSTVLELSQFNLERLTIIGGSGTMELELPDGNYDASLDLKSGVSEIMLADEGRQTIRIDGGSGRVTLRTPEEFEGKIVLESGLIERVTIEDNRLRSHSAGDGEASWQTGGYLNADSRAEISLDIGSGGLTVERE